MLSMRKAWVPAILSLTLGSLLPAAQAQEIKKSDRLFDSVSLYAGQGVDLNLRQVPRAIFSGDWREESSYFWGASLGKTVDTLGGSIDFLRDTPLQNFSHGYEAILLKHHGRQHNAELAGAYLLRTPNLEVGPLRVNFAGGAGLSHAFGTPSYEDGPADDPSRRYRTQFLALFEFEWGWDSLPNLSIVTRIHHRSGVYGVIAPRHVGSNFMVAGLRYRF
jgi:hypothetical protein